jgi:two-component system sensor kinase FixL
MTSSDGAVGAPPALAARPIPARWLSYAITLVVVAVSLLLRYGVRESLGVKVPYLQFYPAIIVAAWFGGLGPGVLATALSALAAMYFLLPPAGFAVAESSDLLSLAVFVGTGMVISWLNHRLQGAEQAHRTSAAAATARAERLDAILNTTVDGIIVIDAKGTIEAFNRGAQELFGYPEDEVIGRNVRLLMPSPQHEQHDQYLARYIATGDARIIGSGREVQGRRRDGGVFPVHLSVGEMRIAGERKFTGMLHDLTKRARLETRLSEQAALAKLGEMAAVVAHEVKNPLAGIRGAVQVFASRLGDAGNAQILKEIIARIDALDQMMKDLLLFARPPQPKYSPTEVVPLVTSIASLMAQDPSACQVDVDIAGAAPPFPADAEMLRIVFQNLLINGVHAMQGKGTIHVAVEAGESTCQIAITDGGPGIPFEIREKIFTPFFTTKSRGSGLGLPTARRLVEAHKGQLVIDCPPTGGTTVVVRLPTA